MQRDDPAARLVVALERCDDLAMASILDPHARMVVDSGDRAGGELRGRARVMRALKDLLMRHPDASLQVVHVNGGPGLALRRRNGWVVGVLGIDVGSGADGMAGDSIDRLWLSTAPGKLAHWNRPRPVID